MKRIRRASTIVGKKWGPCASETLSGVAPPRVIIFETSGGFMPRNGAATLVQKAWGADASEAREEVLEADQNKIEQRFGELEETGSNDAKPVLRATGQLWQRQGFSIEEVTETKAGAKNPWRAMMIPFLGPHQPSVVILHSLCAL